MCVWTKFSLMYLYMAVTGSCQTISQFCDRQSSFEDTRKLAAIIQLKAREPWLHNHWFDHPALKLSVPNSPPILTLTREGFRLHVKSKWWVYILSLSVSNRACLVTGVYRSLYGGHDQWHFRHCQGGMSTKGFYSQIFNLLSFFNCRNTYNEKGKKLIIH